MGPNDLETQRIMSELASRGGAPTPAGMGGFQTVGSVCNQCGMMHPPIPPGQTCSLAPTRDLSGISDVEINKFLVNMKNILISQIQQKKVKDGKKFFQYAIVSLTQALEKYNE